MQVFKFDHVFGPTATQPQVFSVTKPLVRSVLDGYNVCIFAYGQTGSGKTHTMMGTEEEPGINLQALELLFRLREERTAQGSSGWQYVVGLEMREIYNESIRDLLVDVSDADRHQWGQSADPRKVSGERVGVCVRETVRQSDGKRGRDA